MTEPDRGGTLRTRVRCRVEYVDEAKAHTVFYVLENRPADAEQAITVDPALGGDWPSAPVQSSVSTDFSGDDIDIVDDALLNTSPHNAIERQLLNGDVIGLALMSGAIIWSAMGAFG